MKTLQLIPVIVLLAAICTGNANAQNTSRAEKAELTLIVKGIEKAEGTVLFAAGDGADVQLMNAGMESVNSTDSIVCRLKNLPIGKTSIYVFQDLNNNFKLDMENKIPTEPCASKNDLEIKTGENIIEIKLVDVSKFMKNEE